MSNKTLNIFWTQQFFSQLKLQKRTISMRYILDRLLLSHYLQIHKKIRAHFLVVI